jgi:hypothetical protein
MRAECSLKANIPVRQRLWRDPGEGPNFLVIDPAMWLRQDASTLQGDVMPHAVGPKILVVSGLKQRHGDRDPVRSSLGQVVVLQAATEPTSLNPDHRVGQGVKAWITVEGVNRNGVGFDPIGAPGKGFRQVSRQLAGGRGIEVEQPV